MHLARRQITDALIIRHSATTPTHNCFSAAILLRLLLCYRSRAVHSLFFFTLLLLLLLLLLWWHIFLCNNNDNNEKKWVPYVRCNRLSFSFLAAAAITAVAAAAAAVDMRNEINHLILTSSSLSFYCCFWERKSLTGLSSKKPWQQ